jgi:hypothetical protein
MPHIIDRLSALRVADVMARNVVTVNESQSMGEVAQVLQDNEVSSAAVVNDRGHCVGVITATDFVKRDVDLSRRQESAITAGEPQRPVAPGDQSHRIVSTARGAIGRSGSIAAEGSADDVRAAHPSLVRVRSTEPPFRSDQHHGHRRRLGERGGRDATGSGTPAGVTRRRRD